MISETEYCVDSNIIELARQELKNFEGKTALNQPTGNFFYDPWVIKDQFKKTVWEEILSTLNFDHGEARIIVLAPGESYMAHADIDDRYHLNLQGNYSFLIDVLNQRMYPTVSDNKWYEMNAGQIHAATNYGETIRAQLVVRKLLVRTQLDKFVHISITPANERYDYRYRFDNDISPWLNSMNKLNKINNFQFSNASVEFDASEELIYDLVNFDKNIFAITYEF